MAQSNVEIGIMRINGERTSVHRLGAIAPAAGFFGRAKRDQPLDVGWIEHEAVLERVDVRSLRPFAGGRTAGTPRVATRAAECAEKKREHHDGPQPRERPAHGVHNRPRYQSRIIGPTVAAAAAPSARNVPNGSAYFRPPRLVTMSNRPMIVPLSDASISVTSVSCQPRNAPTIASIFTSPIPRPSSCRTR